MSDQHAHGVYGAEYYDGRTRGRALRYRLQRRTEEVERAIRSYAEGPFQTIVDVGTADGLMLEGLAERLGPRNLVGVEMSRPLLRAHESVSLAKVQGDALRLPIKSEVADVVVATAIIEHVSDAPGMLSECRRILRPSGLLVLSTPDPFFEQLASFLGILKEAGHDTTFTLSQLGSMATGAGFRIAEARRFMFSPIGFPAEHLIERVLRLSGLSRVLANQLLVAHRV